MSAVFSDDAVACAKVIREGGVVICPTEGVYGLSCSLYSESAVRRIISIKKRDEGKGLIIVSDSEKSLEGIIDYEAMSDRGRKFLSCYWPGPHTFIVKCRSSFSSPALRPDHSSALRVTSYEVFASVCKNAGAPLISTSANISGNPAASALESVDRSLFECVDFVLTLPCQGLLSSTSIYDTITHTLLRPGPNFREDL